MAREEMGLKGRIIGLLTLLVFAGCSSALAVGQYGERESARRIYEAGTRMRAKVVSFRISKSTNFFGKMVLTEEKHYVSLEVEGAGKIRGEFEVQGAEYPKYPLGSETTVVVADAGRFLPEACRERLLSDRGVLVWTSIALASGIGFLLALAETSLYRSRVRSPAP